MLSIFDKIIIGVGAVAVTGFASLAAAVTSERLLSQLQAGADTAISQAGGAPVAAHFRDAFGQPSRHATLTGGDGLTEQRRALVARAVDQVPGVGGVFWADGSAIAESSSIAYHPDHCQDEVVSLLRTRSVRFEESSAAIAPGSAVLLDEVADALRPCLGSIIAITGHTDSSGAEADNVALSQERALAVRDALVRRGIPADGMRARGVGSAEPVEGLDPDDPANRRIEFSVLTKPRLIPTPIDTPGAR